jgi:hypothetical protein
MNYLLFQRIVFSGQYSVGSEKWEVGSEKWEVRSGKLLR